MKHIPVDTIALISFKANGRYAEVGSCFRTIWKDLKTREGINRRANTYKRPYRVELFHANRFYTDRPFETYFAGQAFDGSRP